MLSALSVGIRSNCKVTAVATFFLVPCKADGILTTLFLYYRGVLINLLEIRRTPDGWKCAT